MNQVTFLARNRNSFKLVQIWVYYGDTYELTKEISWKSKISDDKNTGFLGKIQNSVAKVYGISAQC